MQNPNGQQFGLDTALLCSGGKRALISERQREHKPAVRLGDRQMQPGAFVSQRLQGCGDRMSSARISSRLDPPLARSTSRAVLAVVQKRAISEHSYPVASKPGCDQIEAFAVPAPHDAAGQPQPSRCVLHVPIA